MQVKGALLMLPVTALSGVEFLKYIEMLLKGIFRRIQFYKT